MLSTFFTYRRLYDRSNYYLNNSRFNRGFEWRKLQSYEYFLEYLKNKLHNTHHVTKSYSLARTRKICFLVIILQAYTIIMILRYQYIISNNTSFSLNANP